MIFLLLKLKHVLCVIKWELYIYVEVKWVSQKDDGVYKHQYLMIFIIGLIPYIRTFCFAEIPFRDVGRRIEWMLRRAGKAHPCAIIDLISLLLWMFFYSAFCPFFGQMMPEYIIIIDKYWWIFMYIYILINIHFYI